MRRRSVVYVVAVNAVLALSSVSQGGAASGAATRAPFVTGVRPFLVALAPGVLVQPILTTGDIIGTGPGAYQMSGVPDGIGWYEAAPRGIQGLVNHELRARGDPARARVSRVPR